VGRADSDDEGASWQKHPENPVLALAAAPTAAVAEGAFLLYFERPGEPGIFRADSTDGLTWTAAAAPVLLPRSTTGGAFDRDGVGAPHLLRQVSAAGRPHHALFYAGARLAGDEPASAVGCAGSFDGWRFERYAGGAPVLHPGSPAEHGPTVLATAAGGVMFFHELTVGRGRIAAATH
jgi:hypothetical protein